MEAPSKKTSINVKSGTLNKLQNLKTDTKAKSIDAVLQRLIEQARAEEASVHAEEPEKDEAPGASKRRKIYVAEPLYTMEILRERRGMLEYLTSFEYSDIQLLVTRFSEVMQARFFFRFFCFCRVASSRALVFTHQCPPLTDHRGRSVGSAK